jgi:two-component system, chemotaxis family, chemotaxis protein CheY
MVPKPKEVFMKLLIVDDAKLMRGMIKNAFIDIPDMVMLEAGNGEDAVQLYKATKPDLVTMDITMDLKNGVDAAREILSFDPQARVVMITALGQENLLKECIEMGVKDFIVKPFSKERVLSAISKIMNMDLGGHAG